MGELNFGDTTRSARAYIKSIVQALETRAGGILKRHWRAIRVIERVWRGWRFCDWQLLGNGRLMKWSRGSADSSRGSLCRGSLASLTRQGNNTPRSGCVTWLRLRVYTNSTVAKVFVVWANRKVVSAVSAWNLL